MLIKSVKNESRLEAKKTLKHYSSGRKQTNLVPTLT